MHNTQIVYLTLHREKNLTNYIKNEVKKTENLFQYDKWKGRQAVKWYYEICNMLTS